MLFQLQKCQSITVISACGESLGQGSVGFVMLRCSQGIRSAEAALLMDKTVCDRLKVNLNFGTHETRLISSSAMPCVSSVFKSIQ